MIPLPNVERGRLQVGNGLVRQLILNNNQTRNQLLMQLNLNDNYESSTFVNSHQVSLLGFNEPPCDSTIGT